MIKTLTLLLAASAALSLSPLHAVLIKNTIPSNSDSIVTLEDLCDQDECYLQRESIVINSGESGHIKNISSFVVVARGKRFRIRNVGNRDEVIICEKNGTIECRIK